jgi:hypothetical protein
LLALISKASDEVLTVRSNKSNQSVLTRIPVAYTPFTRENLFGQNEIDDTQFETTSNQYSSVNDNGLIISVNCGNMVCANSAVNPCMNLYPM